MDKIQPDRFLGFEEIIVAIPCKLYIETLGLDNTGNGIHFHVVTVHQMFFSTDKFGKTKSYILALLNDFLTFFLVKIAVLDFRSALLEIILDHISK